MSERLIQLKEFLNDSPNDSFLLFAIAKEYEILAEYDQALFKYKELENQDPDYTATYYHLGNLLEKLDQPEKALEVYQKGMEVCKAANDFHSLSELQNAKTNLELEL